MPARRSHIGQNNVPDSQVPAASTSSVRNCSRRCNHDQRACVPTGTAGVQRRISALASNCTGSAAVTSATASHHQPGCDDGPAPHNQANSCTPSTPAKCAVSQTTAVNGSASSGACSNRADSIDTVYDHGDMPSPPTSIAAGTGVWPVIAAGTPSQTSPAGTTAPARTHDSARTVAAAPIVVSGPMLARVSSVAPAAMRTGPITSSPASSSASPRCTSRNTLASSPSSSRSQPPFSTSTPRWMCTRLPMRAPSARSATFFASVPSSSVHGTSRTMRTTIQCRRWNALHAGVRSGR